MHELYKWNAQLFHGRSKRPISRQLFKTFAKEKGKGAWKPAASKVLWKTCKILDTLSSRGKLEKLILQHLDSFKAIHSGDDVQPKFHFSIHFIFQLCFDATGY